MTIVNMSVDPDKFSTTDLLYRTDLNKLFKNTGTFDTPVFDEIGPSTPSGTVLMFAGLNANIPAGWKRCDGTSLDTTTFASLFAAIGYEWGGGGANFNLPDFETSNVFPRAAHQDAEVAESGGESTHVLSTAELAAHGHGITDSGHTHTVQGTTGVQTSGQVGLLGSTTTNFNKTTSSNSTGITVNNTGSDTAHENKPPYASIYYIIKT